MLISSRRRHPKLVTIIEIFSISLLTLALASASRPTRKAKTKALEVKRTFLLQIHKFRSAITKSDIHWQFGGRALVERARRNALCLPRRAPLVL